mgnify:CR=1 FL=1|jgi:FkbH-like protein
MEYYVFRNMTVERFFGNLAARFSGYGEITNIPECDRYIWWYMAPIGPRPADTAAEIDSYATSLRLVLGRIGSGKMVLALTMEELFGIRTVTSDATLSRAVERYNRTLRDLEAQDSRLKIIDFRDFIRRFPAGESIDWKYYFLSQMALNPRLAKPFADWLDNRIRAVELKRKKCLVLDLDNTLWGGILGEDGIAGIALGGDYPGKAYLLFQKYLKELSRQGVMLAACSKNNLADVREMWHTHPDAVLKEEDFVALKINWDDKATNIRELARELNIGLDSMVFVDDNPAERSLVGTALPEVCVPEFPEHPYMLPAFLKELAENHFPVYSLTGEDLAKTAQYKANMLRDELKNECLDMGDYLRSLEIRLKVREADDITIPRAAQMTQKTNQFNLTTRRYTDADLRAMQTRGTRIFTLSVRDKFGDSGISGLCIVTRQATEAHIDTFLLSCRILGKRIEYALLDHIVGGLKEEGIETITAEYIPTAKNSQTVNFYEQGGFSLLDTADDGTKRYMLRTAGRTENSSDPYQFE